MLICYHLNICEKLTQLTTEDSSDVGWAFIFFFFFFAKFSCFFHDPADIDNLISGSSAFSNSSLDIWKFLVDVLLKPGLENFEHYFARM